MESVDKRNLYLLKPKHSGTLVPKGSINAIQYGVIKVENDTLHYYTGTGITAFVNWELPESEEEQARNGYVDSIALDDIGYVVY